MQPKELSASHTQKKTQSNNNSALEFLSESFDGWLHQSETSLRVTGVPSPWAENTESPEGQCFLDGQNLHFACYAMDSHS